jgi:transposase
MKVVELYGRVRYAVQIEGLSRREAARQFGIDPRTVAKMLAFSVPPGYRRRRPPARPKLDPFTGIIDGILTADEGRPRKQRHTSKRIFERLRDEHGYSGGITIVKDYVLARRLRQLEVFVPLRHDPGHAQADFGEALAEIAGVERKIHFFAVDLPHSDACFVQAYPAETTEAFCEGHNAAFGFFGGVPKSILYDNTKLAVARILGDGTRQRTRVFSELQSHYLFADRFGRPGKGNDKGKSLPRRRCLVPEDWRDGARLWQAVCLLKEWLGRGEAQLVPVVHRRDPRARVATATSLAARRAGGPCGPTGASVLVTRARSGRPIAGSTR